MKKKQNFSKVQATFRSYFNFLFLNKTLFEIYPQWKWIIIFKQNHKLNKPDDWLVKIIIFLQLTWSIVIAKYQVKYSRKSQVFVILSQFQLFILHSWNLWHHMWPIIYWCCYLVKLQKEHTISCQNIHQFIFTCQVSILRRLDDELSKFWFKCYKSIYFTITFLFQ